MITTDVKFSNRFKKIFLDKPEGFIKTFLEKFAGLFLGDWRKEVSSSRYWRLGFHKPNVPKAIPTRITQRTGRLLRSVKTGKSGEGLSYWTIVGTKLKIVLGSAVYYAKYVFGRYGTLEKSLQVIMKTKLKKNADKALKETLK